MRLGALEAGGTKMVCSIGDEHGNVFSRVSYPTNSPKKRFQYLLIISPAKTSRRLAFQALVRWI